MSHIPDQQIMWDRKHANDEHAHFRDQQSIFADMAKDFFRKNSKILDLGCGNGRDSLFFAQLGHKVEATDFSETVLNQNRKLMQHENITYTGLDMSKNLTYADGSFDVVFANLSIHYFNDTITRQIISEIRRVLKLGGIFAFACKADDSVRKKGATEIEKDYFVGSNGHAMHFISMQYAKELVSTDFNILSLDQVNEMYIDRTSTLTRCICRKT